MELHSDTDMFLQGVHRGDIVVVVGRLCDRGVEREISIFPMAMRERRVAEKLDRCADRVERRRVPAKGRPICAFGFDR